MTEHVQQTHPEGLQRCHELSFLFFWIAKVLYVMLVGAYPFDGVREPMEKQIRHFGYVRSLQTLEKEGPHIYSGKK